MSGPSAMNAKRNGNCDSDQAQAMEYGVKEDFLRLVPRLFWAAERRVIVSQYFV